ncbi:hypothetical protein BD779DRAFT_1138260 [Infundibulicybe gibba]|nr:hypothetical protein BD779DRAFT_1138260 [Infundibulicybe gibba]
MAFLFLTATLISINGSRYIPPYPASRAEFVSIPRLYGDIPICIKAYGTCCAHLSHSSPNSPFRVSSSFGGFPSKGSMRRQNLLLSIQPRPASPLEAWDRRRLQLFHGSLLSWYWVISRGDLECRVSNST